MTIYERLSAHREEILAIFERNGARNIRVFGSVARGEADEESDLDLVVDLEPGRTFFDLGGLVYELGELLECRIDVVMDGAMSERLARNVARDARPLLDVAA